MAGFKSRARLAALAFAALAMASAGTPAAAGFFKPGKAVQATANLDMAISEFDRAMRELRLVDAGRILDGALVVAPTDPRLMLRSGELHLARGRFEEATRSFALAEAAPALNAQALQGRGVALAQLGRSDEAIATLRRAVAVDPALWRAWNALGVESDRRRDWATAEAAYAKAIATPSADEIVYNNRGYSRLLQGRYSDASADFVAALDRDPTLTAARMNLRLSLALQGDYARATAVGDKDQKAGVLNNAGFAAVLRGDLDDAQRLFEQAIDNRGSTYGRAYHNLELVKAMKADQPDIAPVPAKP
ncbi:tetratricopeptide repeat protein [Phenylobacterium sp.]|uniref:tetratricopeptide repeat protein n=1 Tax=Phenylobacterium sp. TaxID=1871053 RepID=UPI002737C822|nr:tetratricopeptide repeat protein [Phenylobacterium sp.]MDP3869331.1 tetratricopeptide repeat protein [Phenylobacterium sp.]